jgi:glycosyltransferase involved in cell wall biosynthesis
MCVYDGMPFLPEAVNSVLRQTFTDLEFVIVDDGSRDGSWEALEDFARRDLRIRLIRNASNLGASAARNLAVQAARGDFIAGQDADDTSQPERLQRQVQYLDAHLDIGVLGTAPRFMEESGEFLGGGNEVIRTEDSELQPLLLETNCFCAASVMFRRHLLDQVGGGYDPGASLAEDYDLLLRLAEVTRIANLPDALYSYRQHDRSTSRLRRFPQMQAKTAALSRALDRRYGEAPPDALRRLLARDHLRCAFLGHFVGEDEAAREEIAKAVSIEPTGVLSTAAVEDVFGRYVLQQQLRDPFELVESLFGQVLPPTPEMARARARLLSMLHIREVFIGANHGDGPRIDRHWLPGLWLDLRWARNRGLWAIGLRRVLSRSARLLVRLRGPESERLAKQELVDAPTQPWP